MDRVVLTIKGSRPPANEADRERLRHVERPRGTFLHRLTLPDTADTGKIAARADAGVLVLAIPKAVKSQPSRIPVQG